MSRSNAVSRWSVRSRLVALVLVPVVALGVVAGVVSLERQRAASSASAVAGDVAAMTALVDLQQAMVLERTSAEIIVRSGQLGLGIELALELLGIDLPQDPRGATDQALMVITTPPFDIDELTEARAEAALGDAAAIETYQRLHGATVDALVAHIAGMRVDSLATGDAVLAGSLDQLEASVVTTSSAVAQILSTASVWFADPADTDRAIADLAVASAAYRMSLDHLRAMATDRDENFAAISAHDLVIDPVVGDTLSSGLVITPDPAVIARAGETVDESLRRLAELNTLASADAATTAARAELIAERAQRDFTLTAAASTLVIVVSMVAWWLIGRSIVTPLTAISDTAERLRSGQFDAVRLRPSGPRELGEVARTMNDVSRNFSLLGAKLEALAGTDLGADVLGSPLPGRLGETLDASVRVVSNTMVERAELQERLAHQANHDALTRLANRASALSTLAGHLAAETDTLTGLLFVDLDGFKTVNDQLGHPTGDEVLVEVARRLRETSGDHRAVARLGGDEFVVISPIAGTVDELVRLARLLRSEVMRPIELRSGIQIKVGASIGVAAARAGSSDPTTLLAEADVALYRAKASTQRIVVFDDALRNEVRRHHDIEARLRSAVRAGRELTVLYQPVVDTRTGTTTKVEALVRWDNPEGVGPAVFVPIAERSDLIVELDRWVLNRAMADARSWAAEPGLAELRLAVNLSGRHLLQPIVVTNVTEALQRSGFDPRRLVVEVTETSLVDDQERAAEHLAAIRRLGVSVSVDDFGTGFTSISQLRQLPIDEIKIDRSLVSPLPHGTDRDLVRMVQDLADHLGLTTVAEGVETEDQAASLDDLGCRQLQGWLFAKAMPAHELTAWVASGRAGRVAPMAAESAI